MVKSSGGNRLAASSSGGSRPATAASGWRRAWIFVGVVAVVAVVTAGAVMFLGAGHHSGIGPRPAAAPPAKPPPTIDVPQAGGPINPRVPITVTATGGKLVTVVVHGPKADIAGGFVPGSDNQSWSSSELLGYNASYSVTADAVSPAGVRARKTFTVSTIEPAKTAYANVVPAPDRVAANGIGVGQPMVFQFTAPVSNKAEVQDHLHVTVTPPQPGAWYWVDDKNVHYRGPAYWQPGTKIHLEADVLGLDLGGGVLGAENNVADYTVHDSWVGKADGKSEELTVYHNGDQVKKMPMSLGSPGFPSHEGPHVISDKQPSIVMDSCTYGVCKGQPGYYHETVALDERISNDGEFVHSAPWSVGQQGNENVSHGCVNLSPDNANWFYDHFGIGDVVEITNSGGPNLPVWDTYGDWEVAWPQWEAGNTDS